MGLSLIAIPLVTLFDMLLRTYHFFYIGAFVIWDFWVGKFNMKVREKLGEGTAEMLATLPNASLFRVVILEDPLLSTGLHDSCYRLSAELECATSMYR